MPEAKSAFTIELFNSSDGYVHRYRQYLPSGNPRGQVVCLHGIQSHGGWYERSCRQLVKAGFAVYFLDRRGSGLNDKERGDAPGYTRLLADVAELMAALRLEVSDIRPAIPIFVLAISWGGKLAVALQRWRPKSVRGLVLIAPGFFPRVRPSLLARLGILFSRVVSPERLHPIPLNDPELFTANPEKQQFIRDDPLALRQASARLMVASAWLDRYLKRAPQNLEVPVLLLLAGEDRIIDNERTRLYIERFAATDKEIISYAGTSHTLEFEPDPNPISADIVQWLEKHL